MAALLACAMHPALAAQVPMRVEMEVAVQAMGMTVGAGRDVFEHDGKTYSVSTEARTVGIARALKRMDEKRESRGLVTEQGLRPLTFRQTRTGKAPNAAQFDWAKGELTMDEGGVIEKVALPAGTLDQATLAYAFVFNEPPKADRFKVNVTDGRKLQDYELAFVGREQIETDLGKLETLHFRKVQAGEDKRGFEFWLSVQHYRLPVRIRIVEKDGTAFDSTVNKITYPAR
jgi:hypothetical protein